MWIIDIAALDNINVIIFVNIYKSDLLKKVNSNKIRFGESKAFISEMCSLKRKVILRKFQIRFKNKIRILL